MIKGCYQVAAFLKRSNAVQPHGVKPFKDVIVFAMLRGSAMLFYKALNLFKAGNDALFLGGQSLLFLRLGELIQLGAQFVQINHNDPHL